MNKVTYVVEYESSSDIPRLSTSTRCMGGRLMAAAFEDSMKRIEALEHAVRLLNSMIESGEQHSEVSRAAVRKALDFRGSKPVEEPRIEFED